MFSRQETNPVKRRLVPIQKIGVLSCTLKFLESQTWDEHEFFEWVARIAGNINPVD
jgi:hypothetical protein